MFFWSKARKLWPLAIVGVMVGMIGMVGWQHVHLWQVFYHYIHGWSPIRELVGAPAVYSQSRCVIDLSHCTASGHKVKYHM